MTRRQRAAVADATLAAGATLLLLYATAGAQAGGALAVAGGVALVVLGAALLWGTPRPTLRARMLASVAGLFLGFGLATLGSGTGAVFALGAGALLLLGVVAMAGRSP